DAPVGGRGDVDQVDALTGGDERGGGVEQGQVHLAAEQLRDHLGGRLRRADLDVQAGFAEDALLVGGERRDTVEGGEDGQLERLVGGRRVRRAGAVGGTGGTQCERRDGGRGECAESSGSHGRSSPSVMPESSARAEDASVTGTTDSDK